MLRVSTIRPTTAARRACAVLLLAVLAPTLAHAQPRATRPAAPRAAALLERCTGIPDAAACRAALRLRLTDRQRSLALTYLVEAGGEPRESLLVRAVRHDSTNALAQLLLGTTRGGRREAIPHLAAAVALRPQWTFIHRRIAESYRAWDNGQAMPGGADSAVMFWRRAAQAEPEAAYAHARLGATLGHAGRDADAERAFRRALALEPEHPEAVGELCLALLRQGKTVDAQAPCRRTIRGWNGNHGVDIRNLSSIAENAKDLALALAATEQGLVEEPRSPYHRSDRTRLLVAMKRDADARRLLERYIAAHPSDWGAVDELASFHYWRGELAESRALYRRLIRPACGDSHASCMTQGTIATASLRLGMVDSAFRELRAALEWQADCPAVIDEFRRYAIARPDSAAVLARLTRELEDFGAWVVRNKHPQSAAVYFATSGDWGRAVPLFEQALDSAIVLQRAAPHIDYSSTIRWQHGEALVGQGRWCEGLRELEAALAVNPALATASYFIPDVLAKARAGCREGKP